MLSKRGPRAFHLELECPNIQIYWNKIPRIWFLSKSMNHNEILHIWRQHCQWQRPIEDHHGTTHTHNEYISCFNATCIFQDKCMSNYLPFYILEKDDFAMVHPVGIRFVHLAMVWWLSSLPTAPWLASSGASGSYQWGLVSKPVSSVSPIDIATDNNHGSSRSNNALPPARHQKQTAGCRLQLLCPPYCLQWLVTTSSWANMAALLLPGPGQGRAFQIVTKTHCGPKSLSNFATPPFRPIIYLAFQGNAVFFTVS